MNTPRKRRFDLSWRRAHLPAMLAVILLAGAVLAARARSRTILMDHRVPVIFGRAAAGEEKIDPNTATAASLHRLPGVGPVKARAIVEYRKTVTEGRAFHSINDMTAVHGIGPGIARNIRPYVRLPEE
ncbi:MAG: ComEA family DNA-binding protein [Planctomycetota bacterium]